MIPYGGYITNSSRFSFILNGAQQCSSPIMGVPGAFLGGAGGTTGKCWVISMSWDAR